jgi:hypothetical protein
VDAPKISEKSKKGKVQKDGLPATVEEVEYLTNSNLGAGGAVAAQMPGQKEGIKELIKEGKKAPKVVKVKVALDKTIDNMKTNDPKAIAGDIPGEDVQFSFQALRNRLLC